MICPNCEGQTFMKAVKVVRFIKAPKWLRLLGGPPILERLMGYNAVCDSCKRPFFVGEHGVRKLRMPEPQPEQDNGLRIPPEPQGERDPMIVNRTPGMQWDRGPRDS